MSTRLAINGTVVFLGLAGLIGVAVQESQAIERPGPALFLLAALLALAFSDLKSMRLPDGLTLPLILVGVVLSGLSLIAVPLHLSALGALIGYSVLFALSEFWRRTRGIDGIGLGDAKLLAAGGAWCGVHNVPLICLFGAGLGLALVALGVLTGQIRKSGPRGALNLKVPFGPFLGMGLWLAWCMDVQLIS